MSGGSSNFLLAGAFALGTALFWGTYGPVLQKGHMLMGSGRLRPFICVGIAYLLIAVIGPIIVMYLTGQEMETKSGYGLHHGWNFSGTMWSLAGGAVGALWAFFLIMALNYGGPGGPIFIMPLVFGCAPVISTFTSMWMNKRLNEISPFFAAGLILVAAGAVTILLTAPKPKAPPTHGKAPVTAKEELTKKA
jgi:hypothetical protein